MPVHIWSVTVPWTKFMLILETQQSFWTTGHVFSAFLKNIHLTAGNRGKTMYWTTESCVFSSLLLDTCSILHDCRFCSSSLPEVDYIFPSLEFELPLWSVCKWHCGVLSLELREILYLSALSLGTHSCKGEVCPYPLESRSHGEEKKAITAKVSDPEEDPKTCHSHPSTNHTDEYIHLRLEESLICFILYFISIYLIFHSLFYLYYLGWKLLVWLRLN